MYPKPLLLHQVARHWSKRGLAAAAKALGWDGATSSARTLDELLLISFLWVGRRGVCGACVSRGLG